MDLILGIVIIFFSLLGWLGQMVTAVSHKHAAKLGLTESESDVDSTFFADVRGEAIWDTIILWTLPVAGILLLLNNSWWVYFGLVGGGMYLYFAGRGIFVRLAMQRRGIRIGKPETLKIVYIFLTIWGLVAIVTIFMAVADLHYGY
ncbi:MAG: hypothetical protein K8R79_07395 [Calditrichales bacterium]|nr:hypothetical protein [Calditrichales bacterium]